MHIFDQKRKKRDEKCCTLSFHWHSGEGSFEGSGSFNLEKKFQDTNDITAENDHICNHVGKITPFSVSNLD